MDEASVTFLRTHREADPTTLLLQAHRYPEVDMKWVAQQIEGWRMARIKWVTWADTEDIVYPPRLNREQSSSETTALYKASLVAGTTAVDLTGGMGVDTWALAQRGYVVDYVERDTMLCDTTRHNMSCLLPGAAVRCHAADSLLWIAQQGGCYDLMYIDPARRDVSGHKVYAFDACQPDVVAALPRLLSHCHTLLIKASPMIDVQQALRQLAVVTAVHVVAVRGECREVLFVCNPSGGVAEPVLHSVDLNPVRQPHCLLPDIRYHNAFTPSAEAAAPLLLCSAVGRYLYLPHAALLKAGAFRSLCSWYGVEKLGRNTHLYTADHVVTDFPGRCLRVVQPLTMNNKDVRRAIPDGRCHVVSRNYPLSAAEVQAKYKLKEGNDRYLVTTRLGDKPVGLLCEPVSE